MISGRGTNLQALIDAIEARRLNATIAVVISNRADAAGLQRARAAGIEAITLPHRAYATRDDYDRALVKDRFRQAVDAQGHAVAQETSQPAYSDVRKAILDAR